MKKKVLVSACLLGEHCRYDGATKKDMTVIEALKEYEIIPFCPETPVLGTPRERISVILKDRVRYLITDETHKDVTAEIKEQVDLVLAKHPKLDMIVLKSKSPSCGLGTAPILDENRDVLRYSDGIAAARLKQQYPNIKIVSELDILKE